MKVLSQLHATFSEDHLKEFSDITSVKILAIERANKGTNDRTNERRNKQIKPANARTNER